MSAFTSASSSDSLVPGIDIKTEYTIEEITDLVLNIVLKDKKDVQSKFFRMSVEYRAIIDMMETGMVKRSEDKKTYKFNMIPTFAEIKYVYTPSFTKKDKLI